jgi:hypothetical protein
MSAGGRLRFFDPSTVPDDKVSVFIGKRGTGKSTGVCDLMYHHRKIPSGAAMSGTEESNKFWFKHVPDLFVYGDYEPNKIIELVEHQKKAIRKFGKDSVPAMFLLLDDCMYKKFGNDEVIRQIFMNGRHHKIFFVLTMQYAIDIPPALRGNIDYVFLCKENSPGTQEKLYKNFGSCFKNSKQFQAVMNSLKEFEILVINVTNQSSDIRDVVSIYKPKLHGNFKIGCYEYWNYHKEHYNEKYDNDSDDEEENEDGRRCAPLNNMLF